FSGFFRQSVTEIIEDFPKAPARNPEVVERMRILSRTKGFMVARQPADSLPEQVCFGQWKNDLGFHICACEIIFSTISSAARGRPSFRATIAIEASFSGWPRTS